MKLFRIHGDRITYDECYACTVLAETEEQAVKLAVENHIELNNNIYRIDEIDTTKEGIVSSEIRHG